MDTVQEKGSSVFREAHLRDYWKIVWQGRWSILAIFVVVVGATAAYTFLQTPVYKATAIVEIQPKARRLLGGQDVTGMGAGGFGWFAEQKYHHTQIEIIKSRDIARRVVSTLRLDEHARFEKARDVVESFRGLIRVDPRRDTGLVEVSISGADRYEIQRWVNAVAEAYVDRNFEQAQANLDTAIDSIRRQVGQFHTDLREAERERILTLETQEIFDSENQEEILRHRLQTLNEELTGVEIELNVLNDAIVQIEKMKEEGVDLIALAELAGDARALREQSVDTDDLIVMQQRREQLERDLESAKVEFRPGHPKYEKTLTEMDKTSQHIQAKVRMIMFSLQNRYDLLIGQSEYLKKKIQDAEKYSLVVAKATSQYDIVRTKAETKKQILDVINERMEQVQLSAELITNNVSVLDHAALPLSPVRPRKRINLAVGALLGLFVGLGAVFFLDYLDNTIRTPEDVEKYLGVALLGVVPKIQGEALAHRVVREAYQSLRTSVIFSSKNRERKVLLITSAGPQEGKSSTVSNIAKTLAAAGDRVIVIDCDLRRPRQHEVHELDRDHGLTNYLAAPAEEKDWERYAKQIGPKNLEILTSGPIPPNPPELLGNARFGEMLSMMRERYDWVLIDSPPAATLADSSILAALADMCIFVVKHNRTDRDLVAKTIQTLHSVNPVVAGVVLNNVDLERAYHKDYYYAGYYYQNEDEGEPRKKKKAGVEPTAQVG